MFQEMGIDAVTLANNHALDYGTDALLDTCEVLDGAGILHTGAGKDLNAAKQQQLVYLNSYVIITYLPKYELKAAVSNTAAYYYYFPSLASFTASIIIGTTSNRSPTMP
jgi:poly-gamma-glutamate capsule biosynthesis protein CapA/YwtB (metallophosphatase superfamily)